MAERKMNKTAFAVAAHPDDIEFMMAGTLILLGQAGYELHYMNVANGSCGTASLDKNEIVAIRTQEARNAAACIGAVFHSPLVDDIEICYERSLLRKLCAIVREVRPEVLLIPSPQDYMEDHMNASRLMVSATFCRNMRNFVTDPPIPPVDEQVALYHALPRGMQDQLRNPVNAEFCVDITGVMDLKQQALACHRSQKEWLDQSQGLDGHIKTMLESSLEVGYKSGRFQYAEGWRRHSHMGFGPADFDPLRLALHGCVADSQTGFLSGSK